MVDLYEDIKRYFVFSRCYNGTFPGHWYIDLNEKSNSRKSETVCDEVNDLHFSQMKEIFVLSHIYKNWKINVQMNVY